MRPKYLTVKNRLPQQFTTLKWETVSGVIKRKVSEKLCMNYFEKKENKSSRLQTIAWNGFSNASF